MCETQAKVCQGVCDSQFDLNAFISTDGLFWPGIWGVLKKVSNQYPPTHTILIFILGKGPLTYSGKFISLKKSH